MRAYFFPGLIFLFGCGALCRSPLEDGIKEKTGNSEKIAEDLFKGDPLQGGKSPTAVMKIQIINF